MPKTRVNQAAAAAAESVENVQNEVVETEVQGTSFNFFEQFAQQEVEVPKSRADIIKELLATTESKRFNGLNVTHVVATPYDTHAALTFVVKENVFGDVRSNTPSAYGTPEITLGYSHNVQTSNLAISGVMKEHPKLAIFANDVVDDPTKANKLFAGSKIDIIQQHVSAGEVYINPFSKKEKPVVFERDKIISYVISLTLGPVGEDVYNAFISK